MIVTYVVASVLFFVGLLLGPILNALITRLPHKDRIFENLYCPHCHHFFSFLERLPLLPYWIYKKACRNCHHPIHWRYPLVELLSGLSLVSCFLTYGWDYAFFKLAIFLLLAIVCMFVDIETYSLPIPALLFLGLFGCFFSVMQHQIETCLLGIVCGFAILWVISWIGKQVYKRDVMGSGDKYLNAAIGGYWGINHLLIGNYVAFLLASIVGGILLLTKQKKRHDMLPFGPFLLGGSLAMLYLENLFWKWIFPL